MNGGINIGLMDTTSHLFLGRRTLDLESRDSTSVCLCGLQPSHFHVSTLSYSSEKEKVVILKPALLSP